MSRSLSLLQTNLDRRAHPRVPFQAPVTLWTVEGCVDGLTQDLSEGGLFVATCSPPAPGQKVIVQIHAVAEQIPQLIEAASIAWRRFHRDDQLAGCGVSFVDPEPLHRILYERLVEAARAAQTLALNPSSWTRGGRS